MTDKQMHSKNLSVELDKSRSTATSLIIDGVDVSGCKAFYIKRKECINPFCENYCKESPNCDYKQLKRKEQKCEYWKHQAELGVDTTDRLTKELEEKEQECEELKAELELFKTSNQTTINQLKAENDALFKAIEEVNKINKRLEKEKIELQIQLQNQKHESCHFDKIKELTKEM